MKLTLRYLLAYMDDILKPADARQMGQALSENTGASELVERIRKVIRQRRLSAPAVLETDQSQDANTVAEYLDNLLTPEQTRQFEQATVDSDEQLAEVAASHQILTLILGGGLTVPDSAREKLTQLAATLPAEPPRPASVSTNKSTQTPSSDPDFVPPLRIRQSGTNWKKAVSLLGVVLLAGAWIYSIFSDPSLDYARQNMSTRPAQPTLLDADGDLVAANEGQPGQDGPQQTAASATESQTSAPAAQANSQRRPAPSSAARPSTAGIDPSPVPLPELDLDSPAAGVNPAANMKPGEETASHPGAAAVALNTDTPAPNAPAADNMAADPNAPQPAIAPDAQPVETAAQVPQNPFCFDSGIQYVSSDSPLIVHRYQQSNAVLAAGQVEIQPGDIVLTPSYSQADFQIINEPLSWQIGELSKVQLLGAEDNSCMGFRIEQGQLLLTQFDSPEGNPMVVQLLIGGQRFELELPTQATRVGLSVEPQYSTHFETMPPNGPISAAMWVSGQAVKVRSGDQPWQQVAAYQQLMPQAALQTQPVAADEPAANVPPGLTGDPAVPPAWMAGPSAMLTSTQKRDQREFAKSLEGSSNVWLDLQAIANAADPQRAELAAQTLAIGQRYEALVSVLAYSPHEESRTAAISGLRSWMLRDPENRQLLNNALEMAFNPQTAFVVYHLLWGYDDNDAHNPNESYQLVESLKHEHVAVRELAIYWIHALTGKKLNYRPQGPLNVRETAVTNWERHIAREGALIAPEKE